MFTFLQLKKAIIDEVFPNGRPGEYVLPHNNFFIEAMIEIQQACQCYQVDNTQIVKFCETMFQCGMTVFDAPRGVIKKISTYVSLDGECHEDSSEPVNWCSEVPYGRVEYPALQKAIDKQLKCNCGSSFASLSNLSIPFCQKTLMSAYPKPTIENGLPLGFYYAQAATDLNYRAKVGVWALERGRVYVAPWINSSEVLVVEWDGIKRNWVDADIVDVEENRLLIRAVKDYFRICHFRDLERDVERQRIYEREYRGDPVQGKLGSLEALIHQCREETRARQPEASHAQLSQNTI